MIAATWRGSSRRGSRDRSRLRHRGRHHGSCRGCARGAGPERLHRRPGARFAAGRTRRPHPQPLRAPDARETRGRREPCAGTGGEAGTAPAPTPALPHKGGGESRHKKAPLPLVGRGWGRGARPVVLFDRPEPVEAMAAVPDGPPVRFTWRRVARAVVRAEGPERIAPEWWRDGAPRPSTRDYYVIEDPPDAATGCSARACMARKGSRPGSSTACSPEHHASIRRAPGHQQFLLPARRLARGRTRGPGKTSGAPRPGPHRPQLARRHRAGACAGKGNGPALRRGGKAGSELCSPPTPTLPHEGGGSRSEHSVCPPPPRGEGSGVGGAAGRPPVPSPFSPGPPTGRPTAGSAAS
jgi:hypothetical protein